MVKAYHPLEFSLMRAGIQLPFPRPDARPDCPEYPCLFYRPNALIVDPFGGSGTTLGVCRHMERRCLIYDLQPSRDDITKHDMSLGSPKEAQGCDLIFLNPPYWRQKRSKYPKEEGSFSAVALDEFNRKMEKLIRDCYDTVKQGGYTALLIQNITELRGKLAVTGRQYVDHVIDGYEFFIKADFTPVYRISCPLTWEQFACFDVKEAKARAFGLNSK